MADEFVDQAPALRALMHRMIYWGLPSSLAAELRACVEQSEANARAHRRTCELLDRALFAPEGETILSRMAAEEADRSRALREKLGVNLFNGERA